MDAYDRIYYLSPEVILVNARDRVVEPTRLSRVFRLRQLARTVRQHGQIRRHNFGLYIDQRRWGQTVEVLIYDDAVRIEQVNHLIAPLGLICEVQLQLRKLCRRFHGRPSHPHADRGAYVAYRTEPVT